MHPSQGGVVTILGSAGSLVWAAGVGARLLTLFALGLALGATLLATRFGFAGGYRRWLDGGDGGAIQPQLLLLALATVLDAPPIAAGLVFGHPVEGAYAPLGVGPSVGAALFGIGMALAGGCGSGTLFAAGGGSPRMCLALAGFVAGSFTGSLHLRAWEALPSMPPIVLGERIGWRPAIAFQLVILAAASWAVGWGTLPRRAKLLGAVLLAVEGLLVLVVQGRPWSIIWGFALWGAKLVHLAGWTPAAGGPWADGAAARALTEPLVSDPISVVDLGIVGGAALASVTFGAPTATALSRRTIATAIAGGLAMGYGARLSGGCNIGAFLAGVASSSLHGWSWIAVALPAMAATVAVGRSLSAAHYSSAAATAS